MTGNETISPQQRIAFERWAAALPDDELQGLLAACQAAQAAGWQQPPLEALIVALAQLGLSAVEIEATIRAAAADPPDWRKSLH